jgi:hypothetical protein
VPPLQQAAYGAQGQQAQQGYTNQGYAGQSQQQSTPHNPLLHRHCVLQHVAAMNLFDSLGLVAECYSLLSRSSLRVLSIPPHEQQASATPPPGQAAAACNECTNVDTAHAHAPTVVTAALQRADDDSS